MRGGVFCGCVLAVLAMTGCDPEERIWWSPLGDRAIVHVNDKLHLVSADGTLGGELLGGAPIEDQLVKTLSWLPDGKGFVCTRTLHVKAWDEVKKLIPEAEAQRVESALPMVLPTVELAMAQAKGLRGISSFKGLIHGHDEHVFEAGLRVLFGRQRDKVEKVLSQLPQAEAILAELDDPNGGFAVQELCVVGLEGTVEMPPRGLVRGLLELPLIPKVSPKHDAVAYLQMREDTESVELKVVSLDGTTTLSLAQQVASIGFEWMPDGRSLVFAKALGQRGDSVQSIQQVVALQESGALMKPMLEAKSDGTNVKIEAPDRLAEAKLLALAILPGRASLHPLPDGRVLFASQPVTLPMLGANPELEPLLHVISADGQTLSTVPTAPGDLPTDLNYLVVAPDGKHVAVVESETDAVAVVELSTGKTEIISVPHPGWKCETIPAWKSATELTFAALDDKTQTPRWMLWTAGAGTRALSQTWPASATSKWLSAPKSETKTTDSP